MTDRTPPLSPAGRARREIMLEELTGELHRVRRRRRRVRRAVFTAPLVVLVIACLSLLDLRLENTRPVILVQSVQIEDVPSPIRIVWEEGGTGRIQVIDDEGLVDILNEIDRPAGVIRFEGRTWITRAVTDAQLGLESDPEV